mgnify:CR=1 FL=1
MNKKIFFLTLFSIAMGFLEAAVVIYLREIYYPHGFHFPMAAMSIILSNTELLRELATILMLLSITFLVGKTLTEKFAVFIFCFAIWDIFYYVFLFLILGWPESLFTWDILFLIPIIWTSPVLAPILVSITFILYSLIIFKKNKYKNTPIGLFNWILIIVGSIIIYISLTSDFMLYYLHNRSNELNNAMLNKFVFSYIPYKFNWLVFGIGEAFWLFSLYKYVKK